MTETLHAGGTNTLYHAYKSIGSTHTQIEQVLYNMVDEAGNQYVDEAGNIYVTMKLDAVGYKVMRAQPTVTLYHAEK